jgi:ubiquitin-like protein Pup
MSKQERIQKPTRTRDEKGRYTKEPEPQVSEEAEALKAETDALLDEIDALLEENAEAFVAAYVQKGGE